MSEEIRPIPGWEGLYSASRSGKIYTHRVPTSKRKRRGKKVFIIDENSFIELKPSYSKARGYYMLTFFTKSGKKKYPYYHRLLAQTFLPNPKNYKYVNHIDGVKTNNDLSNLEWCTKSHDGLHAYRLGLARPVNKIVTKEMDEEIWKLYKEGMPQTKLAVKYNVHRSTICRSIRRKKESLK